MELLARTLERLKARPVAGDWVECLLLGCALAGAGVVLEAVPLADGNRPALQELALVAGVALVFPALCEEALFRGVLLPQANLRWGLLSTLAFVSWHPLEATLWLPSAWSEFTKPPFLLFASLLSLACVRLVARSRSLWPAVALHWIVVVLWKASGGARFLA